MSIGVATRGPVRGVRRVKFDLSEAAGSLGDLATFIPLAVGLITVNGVNATSLFLAAGLLYVVAGLYYGLPIPVQPLKAVAAIAIALAVPQEAISAAAFWMGAIFLLLSRLRLDVHLRKVFTRAVVRGVQLGLAVLLVRRGLAGVFGAWDHSLRFPGVPAWAPGAAVGTAVAAIVLLSREGRRYPATLVAIPFGVLAGGVLTSPWTAGSVATGWIRPEAALPLGADPYLVFVVLLLPQVPLTLANSIAATCDAAATYYGPRARRVTPGALAVTLGIGNLLAGLIGGMPLCHGSGGVTAHHRFGARTGGANLIIGAAFVLVALLYGRAATDASRLLPPCVLGALLVYVGVQHARLARDIAGSPRELAVALCIGAFTLATGNLAVSFGAGFVLERAIRRCLPAAGESPGGTGLP
ncbi:MAG: putative sulfate/molybdate transporter [Gemmatimonadota bacterium]